MEYVLVLNYVEAGIPFIYASYMFLSFYLPNKSYYMQLSSIKDGDDLSDAVTNALLYGLMQIATFVVINVVYARRAKISGIKHLTFVLERQASDIQTKLVFWVLYNAQASLTHIGYDYTFEFAWLRSQPSL